MAAAVLKVISLISSTISITNFAKSEIPRDPKTQYDSTVRVAVALNNKRDHFRDADGLSPMIVAFNELGEHIGVSHFDERRKVESGSYVDITVHQDDGPGQQPTTLQLMASNDGLCIAYISQTWPDGATRGWLGDMAKECGYSYYYSNIIVGEEHHKPMCAWIDQDHTLPVTKSSAMQIHMEDFIKLTNQSAVNQDPGHYCSLPAMLFKYHHDYDFDKTMDVFIRNRNLKWNDYTLWTGPEQYDALPPMQRRSLPLPLPLSQPNDTDPRPPLPQRTNPHPHRSNDRPFAHLVISSHDAHSAQACCEDANCKGPDILNAKEGRFCDQDTKTHMPLCGEEVERGCYHREEQSIVHEDGNGRSPRGYAWVEEWD